MFSTDESSTWVLQKLSKCESSVIIEPAGTEVVLPTMEELLFRVLKVETEDIIWPTLPIWDDPIVSIVVICRSSIELNVGWVNNFGVTSTSLSITRIANRCCRIIEVIFLPTFLRDFPSTLNFVFEELGLSNLFEEVHWGDVTPSAFILKRNCCTLYTFHYAICRGLTK